MQKCQTYTTMWAYINSECRFMFQTFHGSFMHIARLVHDAQHLARAGKWDGVFVAVNQAKDIAATMTNVFIEIIQCFIRINVPDRGDDSINHWRNNALVLISFSQQLVVMANALAVH